MSSLWCEQSQLVTHRLYTDDKRETVSSPATSTVYKRKLIRLPSSLCKSSLRTHFDWDDRGNNDYAKRPIILDLFSGGGGAALGYYLAGFRIVGVDIKHQKRYPFEFVQGDALEFLAEYGKEFDVIHASPPCQAYSVTKSLTTKDHPDLVAKTRELLLKVGRPYIIENVPGAPLNNPLMLCGTMFKLRVIRHRLFEIWPEPVWFPPMACCHDTGGIPRAGYGASPKGYISVSGNFSGVGIARKGMDISWMTGRELSQAIPPAYTKYIGEILLERMKQ